MSILFKLKEWLTIAEAARHLTLAMSEDVSEADVLRLALDGHLPLSVYLTEQVYGRMNFAISIEAACELSWESENYTGVGLIEPDLVLIQDDNILTGLVGVVDLVMSRSGDIASQIVEREYLRLMDIAKKDVVMKDVVIGGGIFVFGNELMPLEEPQPEARTYARRDGRPILRLVKLCDPKLAPLRTSPLLQNLPNGSFFVVRAKGIAQLMQSMIGEQTSTDKPLSTTERNSLLVMIAALCKKANIDPQSRAAAGEMVRLADDVGVSMSDDTARKVLKQVPDALGARQR